MLLNLLALARDYHRSKSVIRTRRPAIHAITCPCPRCATRAPSDRPRHRLGRMALAFAFTLLLLSLIAPAIGAPSTAAMFGL